MDSRIFMGVLVACGAACIVVPAPAPAPAPPPPSRGPAPGPTGPATAPPVATQPSQPQPGDPYPGTPPVGQDTPPVGQDTPPVGQGTPGSPQCELALQPNPLAVCTGDPVACAEALNARGKDIWVKERNVTAAIDYFDASIEVNPTASVAFNLCYSLHQVSRYPCAAWACEVALGLDPAPALRQKINLVLADVKARS